MTIRPIRTDEEYQAALKEIERLFDVQPGTPEADTLEIWTTLVEAYEEKQFPIPAPDPIAAIRYHMESRGLSEEDRKPYLGHRVSDVMSRKRPLSLAMIRRLHAALGIPADLLIQPYRLSRPAA